MFLGMSPISKFGLLKILILIYISYLVCRASEGRLSRGSEVKRWRGLSSPNFALTLKLFVTLLVIVYSPGAVNYISNHHTQNRTGRLTLNTCNNPLLIFFFVSTSYDGPRGIPPLENL